LRVSRLIRIGAGMTKELPAKLGRNRELTVALDF
jgi:hypothetical protein